MIGNIRMSNSDKNSGLLGNSFDALLASNVKIQDPIMQVTALIIKQAFMVVIHARFGKSKKMAHGMRSRVSPNLC